MAGLLVKDCGKKTLSKPLQDGDGKFILHMRAIWVVERCLAAGLVHQDMAFRNIVYDPTTLDLRVIVIGPVPGAESNSEDVWLNMDGGFYTKFGY